MLRILNQLVMHFTVRHDSLPLSMKSYTSASYISKIICSLSFAIDDYPHNNFLRRYRCYLVLCQSLKLSNAIFPTTRDHRAWNRFEIDILLPIDENHTVVKNLEHFDSRLVNCQENLDHKVGLNLFRRLD